MGAVPLIAPVAMRSLAFGRRLPGFFVRKAVKDHGTKKRVDGNDIAGKSVVILEDVTTTGGSAMDAVKAVTEAGAKVALVLVDPRPRRGRRRALCQGRHPVQIAVPRRGVSRRRLRPSAAGAAAGGGRPRAGRASCSGCGARPSRLCPFRSRHRARAPRAAPTSAARVSASLLFLRLGLAGACSCVSASTSRTLSPSLNDTAPRAPRRRPSDQRPGVAGAELARPHQVLHALGQLQQAQRVGEMAAALADDLGEVLLRVAVAVHQELVPLPFLDRVQVLALDVLDDGDLDRFLVGQRADDHRHVMQIGELRRAPAALAGDDLIGVARRRPDHERLHQPALADRGRKLLELRLRRSCAAD